MSKNLTLKGAAFGALVALSISAVAPASAAGLADTSFVALAPKTGTEYSVLAGAGKTFTLTANEASTIVGGDVKHLVTDASDLISTTSATTGRTVTLADATRVDATTAEVVTITSSAISDALDTGDVVSFTAALHVDDGSGSGDADIAAADTAFTVTVDKAADTVVFTTGTTIASALSDYDIDGAQTLEVIREARNTTDHTFVVDSGVHTSATNEDLVLVSDSDVTRSVTVQSWVDSNDNDVIDSTEYASPVRTVTFVKTSEVTATTTLVAPVVGDDYLTATITTVPVLNGEQVEAQDGDSTVAVGAYFTRQDSTSTGVRSTDANTTWSDTTKKWTAKVPTAVTGGLGTESTSWTGLFDAGSTSIAITEASSSITSNVATIETAAAHYLRVGDKVTISGVSTRAELNATHTITAVPSSTSFKFAVTSVNATTIDGTAVYAVATYGSNQSITDRVFVGTHSAQATIGSTKLGTATTGTTGASASADSTLSIAGSSSVQAGEFSAVADTNNVQVKKGTTSVAISVAVVDADDAAVSAGRPVVISLGSPNEGAQSGTFKINGLTAPQTLLTDGSGKVTFTVSEATGAETAQVSVTATPEGLSDAASSVDLIWNAADYKLYDLATNADGYREGRSIDANGSLVLKLAYLDQWNSAPADGAYRLLVENAGNTVSSNYVALASGRATVTIADNQIGAGSVIDTDITVQEKDAAPATTWTNVTADSWSTGNLGDLAIAVVAAQTAKINLDADGASLYGSAAADLSDAVAAKKTVATDIRTSYVARPTYTNDVVVSGQVANAVTGLLRANASVTISGDSSILFRDGQVDAFGSLTFLADSSGKFAISAFSTKAAKDSVITVTSGGKSATVKVTFTAGAAETVSFAPAATSKEGRTIDLAVKFYDSYGNLTTNGAPQATFAALSGPGWLTNTAAVVAVDGVSSVKLVTQVGDTGLATVKVTTNVNDAAGDAITSTKSILIGVSATVSAGSKKANVVVKNASGLTVKVVSGSKSTTKTATSDSYKVSLTKLTAGKKTVKVYVNDILVSSKKVSVRR